MTELYWLSVGIFNLFCITTRFEVAKGQLNERNRQSNERNHQLNERNHQLNE
ncbi:MAG: hypothetical protein JST20_11340 [Bacteroidetes bacterium]|nr:hypothetical protein [Bacteroidota bacterium]